MKTADFIPLILLELNGGDKYGLEITKSIEKRSSGKILIKQATLYTLLKKLEKSKFISSYWLDSDIGGKRHYYKITQNGKMQAATFPNYNEVVRSILSADESGEGIYINEVDTQLTILDAIDSTAPIETILPTQEVFTLDGVDNSTSTELNKQNSKILQKESKKKEDVFASNNLVKKFTEKPETKISVEYKEQLKSIYENTNKIYAESDSKASDANYSNIKYVDYVDFRSNQAYLYGKKIAKKMWWKIIFTCAYLVLALSLTSLAVPSATNATLYYIALVCALLVVVFYPTIYSFNSQRFRLKCEEVPYKYKPKRNLIISIITVVVVIVLFLLLNLTVSGLTLKQVFAGSNFVNFYLPIILSSTVFADMLFSYIFLVKQN